jgi:hypothetical protein
VRPHLAQCSLHNAPKLDLVDLIKVTGESAGDFAVEDKALARAKRARDSQQFGLLSLNVSIGHSASSPPSHAAPAGRCRSGAIRRVL